MGTPRGGADAGRSRAQDVGHKAAVEAAQPLARPEVAHGARGCRVLHHVAPDDGALLQDGADHLCANRVSVVISDSAGAVAEGGSGAREAGEERGGTPGTGR